MTDLELKPMLFAEVEEGEEDDSWDERKKMPVDIGDEVEEDDDEDMEDEEWIDDEEGDDEDSEDDDSDEEEDF